MQCNPNTVVSIKPLLAVDALPFQQDDIEMVQIELKECSLLPVYILTLTGNT